MRNFVQIYFIYTGFVWLSKADFKHKNKIVNVFNFKKQLAKFISSKKLSEKPEKMFPNKAIEVTRRKAAIHLK